MDTFAALALATEEPTMKLLELKPYTRNESIITPVMWRNILGQVIYQLTVLILILFPGKGWFGFNYTMDTKLYEYGVPTDKAEHYTILF